MKNITAKYFKKLQQIEDEPENEEVELQLLLDEFKKELFLLNNSHSSFAEKLFQKCFQIADYDFDYLKDLFEVLIDLENS
jgi:hypothetical protein